MLINVGSSSETQQAVREFNVGALSVALREALEHPTMECVALRVCGAFVEPRWAEIMMVLRAINDARVMVWRDDRPLQTWEDHDAWMFENIKEGRDVWTEAKRLSSMP